MRGHLGSAISHVDSGARILLQIADGSGGLSQESCGNPLVPIELLAVLFSRLDTQVKQLQGGVVGPRHLARRWQRPSLGFGPDIPREFVSIEQARHAMDYTWNDIISVLTELYEGGIPGYTPVLGPETLEAKRALIARSTKWAAALEAYLTNPKTVLTGKQINAAKLLQMFATLAILTLKTMGASSELMWDGFEFEYQSILDNAEYILRSESEDRQSSTPGKQCDPLPRFQLDMGLVPCLFEVFWKCRDPAIRRKAVALLEAYPRQEGLWDSTIVARTGHRVIELEEGLNGENLVDGQVPVWCRISAIDVVFDLEERKGKLTFFTTRSFTEPEKVKLVEMMYW
jgi:hypothetical protein